MMAYIADIVVGFRGRGVAGQIFRAAPMKRSPRRWCSMRAVPLQAVAGQFSGEFV